MLFNILSPFYLILASMDRILVTSPNALTRQRSTRRLAYLCIIGGTLFWMVFHSHALVLTTIIQIGPNYFLCYFQPGTYLDFNIRSNIHRIRPAADLSMDRTTVGNKLRTTSSKDRQMAFMLLMDTTIYALCSFVFAIFLLYQQITQNYIKSADQIQLENSIRSLCLFGIGIPFCVSCYGNLIVSKTFRIEIKKLFS